MNISPSGLAHLKRVEGSVIVDGRHWPYDDATGRPVKTGQALKGNVTIGYGHLVPRGADIAWEGWSEDEAEEQLLADVAAAEDAVNDLVRVPLTQGQFDALVSFAFNVGRPNFAKTRLLALVNAGDMGAAATRFDTYTQGYTAAGLVTIPGLARRRTAERALFEGVA